MSFPILQQSNHGKNSQTKELWHLIVLVDLEQKEEGEEREIEGVKGAEKGEGKGGGFR
jgi:hypothetical protein